MKAGTHKTPNGLHSCEGERAYSAPVTFVGFVSPLPRDRYRAGGSRFSRAGPVLESGSAEPINKGGTAVPRPFSGVGFFAFPRNPRRGSDPVKSHGDEADEPIPKHAEECGTDG